MWGGKKGLLVNSRDFCRGENRANLNLIGQNGRRAKSKPLVKTSCPKGKRKKGRSAKHSRR